MKAYIFNRIVSGLIVILLALTIVFVLMNVTGDPVRLMLPAEASEEAVAYLRQQLGLDKPLPVRYLIFLQNIVRGDFGDSLAWRNQPALDIVLSRMPKTIWLSVISIAWSSALSLVLGIISARRQGSIIDKTISGITVFGQTAPSFWVGLILIIIFAVRLKWLPPTGYEDWTNYLMPTIVIGLQPLARNTRLVRSLMLETLSQDYIITARAKGVSSASILYKHALKNVAIPLVTSFGQILPGILGGSMIIETVFAWPGVGYLMITSIGTRDFPVVQCCVCFIATAFVVINLLIDFLYGVLDPRIKIAKE